MASSEQQRKDILIDTCYECGGQAVRIILPEYVLPETTTKPSITVQDVECFRCVDCQEIVLNAVQIEAIEAKAKAKARYSSHLDY